MKENNRIGETNINNQNLYMKIIKYEGVHNIDIEFENGYISKRKSYQNFKNGKIRNPYFPEIYNVGYIGEGKYQTRENKKQTKEYKVWYDMIKRCYDSNFQRNNMTYKNCIVCKEWLNFQNFAKWFEDNYYEIDDEQMHLDKDILVKGNKIYSPDTCVFVPQRINVLFIKTDKRRGNLPIGVYHHKRDNKFVSRCSIGKEKRKILGYFDTEIEAFKTYKEFKEFYIKQIAEGYKDKIPKKLYNAMYNWKVEIDD